MALPFFGGLRRLYPHDHITCISKVAANELGTTDWDEFYPLRDSVKFPYHYDLGITLPSSVSSAWLLYRLGIPVRIGYAEGFARLFLTDALSFQPKTTHKREIYSDCLRWLGGIPLESRPSPRFPRKDWIVVSPGASISLREWPFYPELTLSLNRLFPRHTILMIGQSSSEPWAVRAHRVGGVFDNRIGQTTLGELKLLLSQAAACVANDSGVAHLAGWLGCPTVAIFGPGDPSYIVPASKTVRIIRDESLRCSPCERRHCRAPFGYQRCLRNVSVEQVTSELRTLMKELSLVENCRIISR